ncbi:Hint domain-containing protein [Gluconobacter cerinus]|uniref:Hint domain-containing protein n=1 Tax=Gluconobacter cerinus TaxID=38307 RepID=UPI001C04D29D|nr:Hint domain-containing protein [Gluconobacter cerinus]
MSHVTNGVLYVDDTVNGGTNPGSFYTSSFSSVSVSSGGTYGSASIVSGGTVVVQSGGSVFNDTVSSGGVLTISAGGSGSYISLKAGATFNIGTNYDNQHMTSLTALSGTTINVLSGGVLSNADAGSQGTIVVNKGGTLRNAIISSGGGLAVNGTTSNTTVNNGGVMSVASGGTASGGTINAGGSAYFAAGATMSALTLNGGTLDTYVTPSLVAGGFISGTLILESGVKDGGYQKLGTGVTINLKSGAALSNSTIGSGNNVGVWSGATASGLVISGGGLGVQGATSNTTVISGGVIDIASGGNATGNTVSNGGSAVVLSGGTLGTTTLQSGATLSAAAGSTISGTVTAAKGATLTIPTTAGGTIDLQGNGNVGLTITGSGNPTTVISGFSEDKTAGTADGITLTNVKTANVASVTYPDADHVTFTLKDGSAVTLNIIGVQNVGYTLASDSSGDLVYEVCFLADTLIAGPHGNIAVQDLAPGDTVTSYRDGQAYSSTVSWAGKAHCVVRPEKADDEAGYPVRILENAIALGVPFQDMLVTSEHCLFLDGKFIPARMLVNGRSIYYDKSFTSYDYFHIETEDHSVIMANGALTESYLDTGNRRAFEQKSNVFMFGQKAKSWENDAAAALTVCRDLVEPVYRQIEQRAQELQFAVQAPAATTVTESDLHLVSDRGHRIQPLRTVDNRVMFMIPSDVSSVRIVSNSSRPADAIGPFVDDRRMLGVLIGDVSFFDSGVTVNIKTHLTKENLSGWHSVEHIPMRWTNGNAYLPLGARLPGGIGLLAIKVEAAGPYVVAPADDVEVALKTA